MKPAERGDMENVNTIAAVDGAAYPYSTGKRTGSHEDSLGVPK
jgi:hypothetical protein